MRLHIWKVAPCSLCSVSCTEGECWGLTLPGTVTAARWQVSVWSGGWALSFSTAIRVRITNTTYILRCVKCDMGWIWQCALAATCYISNMWGSCWPETVQHVCCSPRTLKLQVTQEKYRRVCLDGVSLVSVALQPWGTVCSLPACSLAFTPDSRFWIKVRTKPKQQSGAQD